MTAPLRAAHVVVIGGYGFFGRRLVERLSVHASLTVTIAGRSLAQAQALADALQPKARAALRAAAVDIHASDFDQHLLALSPDLLIHTGGPFQGQDYHVARSCIAAGVHYIDLADGRTFVQDRQTDAEAPARRRQSGQPG